MKIFIQLALIACLAFVMVQADHSYRKKSSQNCYYNYAKDVKKACGVFPKELRITPRGKVSAKCCVNQGQKPCSQEKLRELCGKSG